MFDSRRTYRSVILEFFIVSFLEDYDHLSFLPLRLSDKHLVYSLASSRWYLRLLSMYRCLYGHFLLLSDSSYLVAVFPPPMMLSLVSIEGGRLRYP